MPRIEPIKAPCRTCEEGGEPGRIWKEGELVECWTCNGTGWEEFPQAHVCAARKDSPDDSVACLFMERARYTGYFMDLNSYQTMNLVKDLLRRVQIKPPVNDM